MKILCRVFTVVLGVVLVGALFLTESNTLREGAGFVRDPQHAGWGGWPQSLYGEEEKISTRDQQRGNPQTFMRHSDGYGEIHSDMLTDVSVTSAM